MKYSVCSDLHWQYCICYPRPKAKDLKNNRNSRSFGYASTMISYLLIGVIPRCMARGCSMYLIANAKELYIYRPAFDGARTFMAS